MVDLITPYQIDRSLLPANRLPAISTKNTYTYSSASFATYGGEHINSGKPSCFASRSEVLEHLFIGEP